MCAYRGCTWGYQVDLPCRLIIQVPGPLKEPKIMTLYPKIESIGSIGSNILAILEVQVASTSNHVLLNRHIASRLRASRATWAKLSVSQVFQDSLSRGFHDSRKQGPVTCSYPKIQTHKACQTSKQLSSMQQDLQCKNP